MPAGNFIKFILFLIVILNACSAPSLNEAGTGDEYKQQNIRFVNLNIIFDFMVNNDPGALKVRRNKEEILNAIEEINTRIAASEGDEKAGMLLELQEKQAGLIELKKEEEYYKNKILNEIDRAIGSVSRREEIDFVFNTGEGALYAKKEYDITENVLEEISSHRRKSAPVSR